MDEDVQFLGEDSFARPARNVKPQGLTGWLIARRIVPDEASANQYLLVIVACVLALAALIIWFSIPHSFGPKPPPPTDYHPSADIHAAAS